MNFLLINYYRDHGYGMGKKIGFFSGLVGGEKQEVLPSGMTFPESERHTRIWKRWYHYLKMDQWLVFFTGAMVGMFVPSVLVRWLASQPGAATPTSANMPVYAATELGKQAAFLFPVVLIIGTLILFKTQTTILEMLTRNTTDTAIAVSPRLRHWISGDSRQAYYLIAITFILVISVIIHLALPTNLLIISGNMSNMASIIFPFVLIYLNTKLPKGALDMAGNVWEWVNDWWQYDYYSFTPYSNPPGPASGTYKVLRGGNWYDHDDYLRVAYRDGWAPSGGFGFRCAATP